ncbi:MAG: restriction endonuclease subunit S [Faecalibacterium sp.]
MGERFDVRNIRYSLAFSNDNQSRIPLGELTSEEPCYGTSATAIERVNELQPKYIRITDFDDFGIEADHVFMTAENYSAKHELQKNDILFARTGATVGKTYFYDGSIGKAIFAGYCIRFRFDENKVMPKFVYWYTKTDTFLSWVNGIQRPSGQPNINKEEYKSYKILVPSRSKQEQLSSYMDIALAKHNKMLYQADRLLSACKDSVFSFLNLYFREYKPALYSVNKLEDIRELGIYCNPHSDYLNDVFSKLRANNFFAGHLEDFVEINPKTSRAGLQDKSDVSFVPMTVVTEKTNQVVYELKPYSEVKTGFTIFKKNDLLWAKITPCMQNGKSFVASDMPTDIGFGSTEFHVLRAKNPKRVYMPYLWVIFSNEHILEAAQGMFGGSAGQQRVPDTFLKKFPIVLPPYEVQVKLADQVFEALEKAKKLRAKAEYDWQNARKQFEKELLGE